MRKAAREGEVVAGKYRIEGLLGEGGMGRVMAAIHEQLGQRVAVKFLLPAAVDTPQAVDRFLREARASVMLKSEHVGRVLDVGSLENGAPYIVMEYLEGTDLHAELTRRGALPPAEAVDYVLQACEALAEAHVNGIVHRDVKPANLFLTRTTDGAPLVKVLDFGISKMATGGPGAHMTATQAVIGSPGYMSPEQLRSSRRVDPRSDIWSLGVVLYELLSGRQPFGGEAFTDLCITIATEPPAPLRVSGISPELEATIERCLEKDPAARFQNVAELAAALAPFANGSRAAPARIARVLQLSDPASRPNSELAADSSPSIPPIVASSRSGVAVQGSGRRVWLVAGAAMGGVLCAVALVAALLPRGRTAASPVRHVAPAVVESVDAGVTPVAVTRADASSAEVRAPRQPDAAIGVTSDAAASSVEPSAPPSRHDAKPRRQPFKTTPTSDDPDQDLGVNLDIRL